jgi:hypothetical protein
MAKAMFLGAILVGSAVVAMPNAQGNDWKDVSKAEAEDFVEQQFDDYFVDCEAFVDSFNVNLLYCDGGPCFHNKAELLEACLATEGSPNTVWDLRILPSTRQDRKATEFVADYNEITAVGQQTVSLPLPGFPGLTPLCFDFAISESLTMTKDDEVKSIRWEGYYKVFPDFGGA